VPSCFIAELEQAILERPRRFHVVLDPTTVTGLERFIVVPSASDPLTLAPQVHKVTVGISFLKDLPSSPIQQQFDAITISSISATKANCPFGILAAKISGKSLLVAKELQKLEHN
jgi:hypothetical protein